DFYFQAFNGSVSLSVAGYNYNSGWISLCWRDLHPLESQLASLHGQNEYSPRAQDAGRHDCPGNTSMKTDELVTLLSTNLEPVDRRPIARTLYVALAAGSIVALGLSLVGLGVRSDLTTAHAFIFLVMKLAFAFGIVGLALVYLTKLAR